MLFQPRTYDALRATRPGGLWLVLLLSASGALTSQAVAAARGDDIQRELGEIAERRGFESTHELRTGVLPAGTTHVLQYELRSGISYSLLSICATDCQGMRMVLRDEAGREVDQDRPGRRAAMVSVTPRWTGTFRLHLSVDSCRDAACSWAAGAFTRNQLR